MQVALPRSRAMTSSRCYRSGVRALSLLLVLAFIACKDKSPPAPPRPVPVVVADAGSRPARTNAVRVDRRIELLSIICRLAGYPEYTRATGTMYLDAVDAWFAPYKQHAAVTHARTLRAHHHIAYDAPMTFAVHLDDALALQNAGELATIDARWEGVDATVFASAVQAFAAESRLDAFLAEHAAYHATLVRTLEDVIAKENPVAWFDAVFGPAEATFVAVPSPIAKTNNFGVRATATDGTLHMYQVLGVAGRFGAIDVDEQFVGLLIHEMAHSYINPVFAKHRARLEPAAANVYALVEKQMRAQRYADPMTMSYESGVRAVVVNYMREKHGDEAGARQARAEQRSSFLWINELAEVMRRLARERQSSPSYDLERHMPKIVAFFDQLAESYKAGLPLMPFRGPVDAVHQREPVWVLPASSAVAGYARMIHTQLKKTGAVVIASETTMREQRGHDLVAYGTPTDNPVIAFVARAARWKISKDSIVLGDQKFTGPGLVLIACWFVRDDPARGVAVYTAPDSASLVGINSLRHGPNDWLVARKQGAAFAILGAGDFPRGLDDMWMLPGEAPVPEAKN